MAEIRLTHDTGRRRNEAPYGDRTHDRTLTKRNNMQPMGAPADDGEDEMAITRVIMITTTVVQIENHRKRGRSPKVKVKTKSNTDTHTEEEVVQGLW